MKYSGWDYLDHMLMSLSNIKEFMDTISEESEFVSNKMLRSAVTMELLGLSELVKKTVDLGTLPGNIQPWKGIIRFRDRTAHWYHTTDFALVYRIVVDDLPELGKILEEQKKKISVQDS